MPITRITGPLMFILASLIYLTESVTWYIEPCRLTTSPDGTLTLCEQKADCASEVTGSTVECSQYTYSTLSLVSECIKVCCYELSPVPTDLNGILVKQCYDQSELRRVLYVVKIVFIVCGCVGLVAGTIAFFVFAFVRNPYTGKRVFVGCCCCRRVPDFQRERQEQMQSLDKLEELKKQNVMDRNEKKINKIELS